MSSTEPPTELDQGDGKPDPIDDGDRLCKQTSVPPRTAIGQKARAVEEILHRPRFGTPGR